MISAFTNLNMEQPMSLWIDDQNALEKISKLDAEDYIKQALLDLHNDGIAVLRGIHSADECTAVVDDYLKWSAQKADYVSQNLDELGRPKRLVNFQMVSANAMKIGASEKIHKILDILFDKKSSFYTSLTFKYGTQQPVHRDTPHFATWPGSQFVGVWTALEDVDKNAGPLFYHKGGHRLVIDSEKKFLSEAIAREPNATQKDQLRLALDLYNGEVIRKATAFVEPTTLMLNKGDVVIWHPQMPHGGTVAGDPMRSRWSIVCHCAPESVQVFQHDMFFLHEGPNPPANRYGFINHENRKVALSGDVSFM
ncbi:hypothetical protein D0B88_03020 [Cellvibrio sp. KY-YJ-3]|nr:hypothetical protein D0B88_03020 [Cellvibrio sp. KY-YJ-3]